MKKLDPEDAKKAIGHGGILPRQLEALFHPSQLLPGENIDHYHALQTAVFQDLDPQSAIESLLAIDIAELSWDIQR